MHNDNSTKLQDWDNLNSDIDHDEYGVVVRKVLEIVYDYSLESAKPMTFFFVLLEVPVNSKLQIISCKFQQSTLSLLPGIQG